jgi:hypothetical protein
MAKPILNYNEDISHQYTPKIEYLTIEAEETKNKSKSLYKFNGSFYTVEEFSRLFFKENGYSCVDGVDFTQVFSHLSFNFDYDTQVHENYILGSQLMDKKTLDRVFKTLKGLRDKVLNEDVFSTQLFEITQHLIELYYSTFEPKRTRLLNVLEFIKTIPDKELIKLVKFYYRISGLKRGSPDLVVYNKDKYWLVEVKSSNDSLSKYQIFYFNYYQEIVGDNIFVLSVVDKDWY